MKNRSNWAKKELIKLVELEGETLDLIAIHEACKELSLESPLKYWQELRLCKLENYLDSILKPTNEVNRLVKNPVKIPSTFGYVYLITSGNNKYKIGSSKNTKNRLKALQTVSYENLELYFEIETVNKNVLETILHRKFSNKKIRGEWFELDEIDLEWIRNLPIEKLNNYILNEF